MTGAMTKKGLISHECTHEGRDSRWYTVVIGVRLTDGLSGTIVYRPSSPALNQYSQPS
jgi:hypothetical protein